jgi:hypothetical protein
MNLVAQTTTTDSSGSAVLWLGFAFAYLAFFIIYAVAAWQMYEKAGQPGWKCLIPIYNWYILLKIVGRPGWWLILFLIPFVNFVVWIIVAIDLAKSYGKGTGFAIGLIFLSVIFILILGYGDARYVGPAGGPGGLTPPPPPPAPA